MKKMFCFTLVVYLMIPPLNSIAQKLQFPLSVANDSLISFYTEQVRPDSIENYISMLQNQGTRFMMSPTRREVAEIIQDKFLSLGIETARIDSFQCTSYINLWNLHYDTTTWQYNVVATIPGISNSNEYYVMGAHYDNVVAPNGDPIIFAPGADDNASGVAALFEVARIIQSNGYIPAKTIELVAFAAEELMYYGNSGSEKYVQQSFQNGMDIKLMINNDMIAYAEGQPWKIRISNYVGSENLTWVSEYVTEKFTDISPVILAPSIEAEADCKYFVAAGIHSVYFFENVFNPYYHTNSDLLTNCNIGYCTEAIKISVGVLIGIDDPTVSVNASPYQTEVKIYPNPATNIINIRAKSGNRNFNAQYFILDQTGRVKIQGKMSAETLHTIVVNTLQTGIYLLKILFEDEIYTSKFLIQ
jgi:hypothetical protein